MQTEKKSDRARKLATGITLIIVALGMGYYYYPQISPQQIDGQNVIFQTVVSVSTGFERLTITTTEIQTTTVNLTTYISVTQQLPLSVTISGTAKSTGLGTTATRVEFLNVATGQSQFAQIDNGVYGLTVENDRTYDVYIHYNLTPAGEGRCLVRLWTLSSLAASATADIQC